MNNESRATRLVAPAEVQFLCEIGRRELPPRAMTNREHPDRLPPLIDFINDSINVRLMAVKQVQ